MYFDDTKDIGSARSRYRELAKELHPDTGGTDKSFAQLRKEYEELLVRLGNEKATGPQPTASIADKLKKIAKGLAVTQVPQGLLKEKRENATSNLEKDLYSGLIGLLDDLSEKR